MHKAKAQYFQRNEWAYRIEPCAENLWQVAVRKPCSYRPMGFYPGASALEALHNCLGG